MMIPILKINQFRKSELLDNFYINLFSDHILINKELISKPHKHNFYLCVIFLQGTGTHEIDFSSYRISPGKVFFLRPGQTHYWKFDSSPEGFIFFHSKEYYEMQFLEHRLNTFPFFYSLQNPPVLELPKIKIGDTCNKLKGIYDEYKMDNSFRDLKIVSLINALYVDFAREYTSAITMGNRVSLGYSRILEGLESLIDENFQKEKLPIFYANQLNITTKHLNRVVKETINKTTSGMISERIILEAKRLLVNSDDSLTTIADTLGFSDYPYFSKVFKHKSGVTPMNFRRKYIQQ